jgi:hypothetical protein
LLVNPKVPTIGLVRPVKEFGGWKEAKGRRFLFGLRL